MPRKTLTKATLDRTFSLCIRERDDYTCTYRDCPDCGNCSMRYEGGLDAAHYYRRYRLSGRWHPDNVTSLCRSRHNYLDEHPPELVRFFTDLLGEGAHDMLIERHHGTVRYPGWERWEMNQHYKAQTKKIERQRKEGSVGVLVLTSWD